MTIMRIALISPRGPLYRHRGGIFKRSLRYQPLTLTTLATLVLPELDAHVDVYAHHLQRFYNCDWHLSVMPAVSKTICG